MKLSKITVLSVAALALASCASEDALDVKAPVADEAINFDVYNTEGSRAMITTQLGFSQQGFKVWANVKREGTSSTSALFSDQKVEYDAKGSKTWVYAPIKYWPTSADATVDFYAVHIDTKNEQNYVDQNTDWNNKPQFNFVVNSKVKDQSDFLWAKPHLDVKRGDVITPTNDKVKFTFQHALSGHFFSFKTAQKDEAIKKLQINSITITGYFAPKAKYNPDATNINEIWAEYYGDWEKRSYTISIENGGIDEALDFENFADGKEHVITSSNSKNQKADAQYVTNTGAVVDAPKCDYIMVLPFNHDRVANPGKQNVTVTVNYTIFTEDADGKLVPQTNEASVDDVFDYTIPGYLHHGRITLTLDKILFDAELLNWNKVDNNVPM